MFELENIGRLVLMFGIGIVLIGGLLLLASRIPGLDQLGQLPGDISVSGEEGRFRFYFPLATSIILSIVLTIVLNVVIRLFNR